MAPLMLMSYRLVAIGACDDAVQVLQYVEPAKDKLVTKGSIFQYCE